MLKGGHPAGRSGSDRPHVAVPVAGAHRVQNGRRCMPIANELFAQGHPQSSAHGERIYGQPKR
eukprot:scaffold25518_cov74-Phaeocystis_antarctica.AAC.8